jgi:hypothetical protein
MDYGAMTMFGYAGATLGSAAGRTLSKLITKDDYSASLTISDVESKFKSVEEESEEDFSTNISENFG